MINDVTKPIYDHIITNMDLDIHFQPIVSVKNKRIIGVEALTRAKFQNEPINPEALFDFAKRNSTVENLDGVCIDKSFAHFENLKDECLLFINFEASMLPNYIKKSHSIIDQLKNLSIQNTKVVIEINEKNIPSNECLEEFIEIYRSNGFLIALDDVGAGHSNLNRIAATKPDIVKIDRQSISSINSDYYKQEITRAIVGLSSRIGAITVAEGIETVQEAVMCLNIGVDLFQGFFFSKAVPKEDIVKLNLNSNYLVVANDYKNLSIKKLTQRRNTIFEYKRIIDLLVNELVDCNELHYDIKLSEFIDRYEGMQCAYILNMDGYQVSETIFSKNITLTCNPLFSPGTKKSRHDVKQYYYTALLLEPQLYITHKYISVATGALCETASLVFTHNNNTKYIACIDYTVAGPDFENDYSF